MSNTLPKHPPFVVRPISLVEAIDEEMAKKPEAAALLHALRDFFMSVSAPKLERIYNSADALPDGVSKRSFLEVARTIGVKRGRTWYVAESAWLARTEPKRTARRGSPASNVTDLATVLASNGVRVKAVAR